MKQDGWHIVKLCTWQGWAWGQGYCFQQVQEGTINPHPHFQWVCSTWATPWARPCLPAAHFQQRHGEGRAVGIAGLCQMPPPAPCLPLSRLGVGGSTYTCRSGYCITYMSPGLRTARPCSPVRTAQPGPCLPHGSSYPNNNTQSPGTSMEWGREGTGSSTQGSAPSQAQQAEAGTQPWPLEKQRLREAKD